MTLRLVTPALLLLLADTMPVAVTQDTNGHYRFSFGFGTAAYEDKTFSCDGNITSVTPVDLNAWGGKLDIWPSDTGRISLYGGRISSNAVERGANDVYDGTFWGGQIAYEGGSIGIGIGGGWLPGTETTLVPSFYFRGGGLDGPHFLLDFFPPSEFFGTAEFMRMGVGFNRGWERKVGGIFGLALSPYSYADALEPKLFGELGVPVSRNLEILTRAQFGEGVARKVQWAVGLGLRVDWGFEAPGAAPEKHPWSEGP